MNTLIITIKDPETLPDGGFRLIYRHWLEARRGAEMPPASALSPQSIPKCLLGDCSLMSIESGQKRFYMRLVGTRTAQELGLDMTNTWGDDRPNADDVKAACQQCVDNRRPVYSDISTAWAGNDFKRAQTLLLPYAGPDGAVKRILAYSQFCFAHAESELGTHFPDGPLSSAAR